MGAPVGNTNASKNRAWRDAIRRKLATFEDKDLDVARGQAIDKLAEKLVRLGLEGEEWAMREIGNRTDGKPTQAVEVEVTHSVDEYLGRLLASVGYDMVRARMVLVTVGADNLVPLLERVADKRLTIQGEASEVRE